MSQWDRFQVPDFTVFPMCDDCPVVDCCEDCDKLTAWLEKENKAKQEADNVLHKAWRDETEQEYVNLYRRLYDTNDGLDSAKTKAMSDADLVATMEYYKKKLHRRGVETN